MVPSRTAERINLVALLLSVILPFTLVVFQLVSMVNQQINFARQELAGNTYLRSLEQLMYQVPQGKLAAHRYFKQDDSQVRWQTQETAIAAAMEELAAAQQQYGPQLHTEDLYQKLRVTWQALQQLSPAARGSSKSSASEQRIRELYTRMIADLRALITRTGDVSNLVLDPDLETYYLMDAVLLQLPEAQDWLAQVRRLGEDVVQRRSPTPEEKGRLTVLIGLLRQTLEETQAGLNAAFYHAPTPTLQTALEPPLQELMSRTSRFLAVLNEAMEQAKTVQVQPTAYDLPTYQATANTAFDASFILWHNASDQLEQLLQQRIATDSRRAYLVEGFTLLVLATVIYLFVSFARNHDQNQQSEHRQAAQHAITRVLAESATLDEATPRILEAICTSLSWDIGELRSVDTEANTLKFVAGWQGADLKAADLDSMEWQMSFAPGVGLPGRVWQRQEPLWIKDLANDAGFLRGDITTRLGIHGAIGFPILCGEQVCGVMSFYSRTAQPPDVDLLKMMVAIGIQIGQFIKIKQAEEAVRQGEELQRMALNAAQMGAWDWNIITSEENWSQEAERIFGIEPGAFKGSYSDFFSFVHPDDRALVRQAQQRALLHGDDYMPEYRIIWQDGSLHWITSRGQVLRDEAGNPTRLVGITQDITSRKRQEERLRLLESVVVNTNDAVMITEPSISNSTVLEIAYVNQAFTRMTGIAADQALGQSPALLQGAKTDPAVLERVRAALLSREPVQGEMICYRQDGSEFWLEFDMVPITDAQGKLTHWISVQRDISDRKQAEDVLRQSKETAEEANRAKSQFLANMSHELRTPLNAIIGYSEMLQEDAEDLGYSNLLPDLESIRSAGKHLLTLINGILDISKIEAGKMELYLETFDIEQLLLDVQSTIQPLIEANHNQFSISYAPSVGSMHADLTKVRQSLFNLLSNAAKFTEHGKITLTVERQLQEGTALAADPAAELGSTADSIIFRVSDTGIGMTLEQMSKVFHAFTQADASTTRKYGGTGLGLVLSRRFCQMMGGDITVSSELGKGSTFTMRLPAAVVNPKQESGRSPLLEPLADLSSPPTHTVLVIDEEAAVRDLAEHHLTRQGFRVYTAADGETGWQLARSLRPDAIVLDVLTPDTNGWALLSSFKADPDLAAIPVVVVTIVEDRLQGMTLGAAEYLTKPVDYRQLASILHEVCAPSSDRPQPPQILAVGGASSATAAVHRMLQREGWRILEVSSGPAALQALDKALPELILLSLESSAAADLKLLTLLRQHPSGRSLPIIALSEDALSADHLQQLQADGAHVLSAANGSSKDLLHNISHLVLSCIRRSQSKSG